MLSEYTRAIPRDEIIKNLRVSGAYPEDILQELNTYLYNPMKLPAHVRKEPVLPNFIILRRGKSNGIDMYWVQDFKFSINKWKSWDKDFIIIT